MTALTDAVTPAVGLPVGVGQQPTRTDPSKPFVVIWPNAGVRSALTMKANDGLTETWICHCYGLTEPSAGVAVRKLTDAIYGLYRTTVGSRFVQWPEQIDAAVLERDDKDSSALYGLAVVWRLPTSPA
jgi:hypothetical protein